MFNFKGAGIYIHVPFCLKKCNYCDFYSIEKNRIDEYLSLLKKSILNSSNKDLDVSTIYFGGGTPSLLKPGAVGEIIELIHEEFLVEKNCETTLELNPGSVSGDYFSDLKKAGINRLNIGTQSFNDDNLKLLGRIHDHEKALNAFHGARRAGFGNIGIDLIFGLPSQDRDNLFQDLKSAVSLGAEHISAYMLTLEKGTKFDLMVKAETLKMLEDEKQAEFFKVVRGFLSDNGYKPYEVSNYARDAKFISKHNYKYWTKNPYLGFGPSAHSYIHPLRWSEPDDFDVWAKSVLGEDKDIIKKESVNREMEEIEFLYLGFRTSRGIDLKAYEEIFKNDFLVKFLEEISFFMKDKYIEKNDDYLFLTEKGFLFLDYITSKFVENV